MEFRGKILGSTGAVLEKIEEIGDTNDVDQAIEFIEVFEKESTPEELRFLIDLITSTYQARLRSLFLVV